MLQSSLISDWGDAEHGGGLRHSEDGDAHQSFLRWDKDHRANMCLIVLEVNITILLHKQDVFPSQFTVLPGLSWSCSILAPWNPSSWPGECQIAKMTRRSSGQLFWMMLIWKLTQGGQQRRKQPIQLLILSNYINLKLILQVWIHSWYKLPILLKYSAFIYKEVSENVA